MNASRKYAVMILALMFTLCAACAYADGGGDEDYYGDGAGGYSGYSDPFASKANVQIDMNENPPSVSAITWMLPWSTSKKWKKTFRKDSKYWVVDELPQNTIFTVPEGYKAKCVSFHTKVVKGKAGKTLDNGRVIYSAGTTVKYTYPSFLQLYKD